MLTQTRYMSRRALSRLSRENYPLAARNPVRVVAWATDPANVGGILRTSEAFLLERAFVLRPPSSSAVGTHRWMPTEYGYELKEAIFEARSDGYTIVALEQATGARRLPTQLPERMCLLVGNEGSGLPASVLANADLGVEIPQMGLVGSLNVVTATSIALYEWMRQHRIAA